MKKSSVGINHNPILIKSLYATLQHVTLWLCSKITRAGKIGQLSPIGRVNGHFLFFIKMESKP